MTGAFGQLGCPGPQTDVLPLQSPPADHWNPDYAIQMAMPLCWQVRTIPRESYDQAAERTLGHGLPRHCRILLSLGSSLSAWE